MVNKHYRIWHGADFGLIIPHLYLLFPAAEPVIGEAQDESVYEVPLKSDENLST